MRLQIRRAKQKMLIDNNQNNVRTYNEVRRQMKEVCRKNKREYNEYKLREIEEKSNRQEKIIRCIVHL